MDKMARWGPLGGTPNFPRVVEIPRVVGVPRGGPQQAIFNEPAKNLPLLTSEVLKHRREKQSLAVLHGIIVSNLTI